MQLSSMATKQQYLFPTVCNLEGCCHNVGKECIIQIKVYFYMGKDIACHADIMLMK